jgi:hypothetical protein
VMFRVPLILLTAALSTHVVLYVNLPGWNVLQKSLL